VIDLHCHILPALDDGAIDFQDSIEMARTAASDGIETVCATPHIRHDHDVVIGELEHRVRTLNEALDDAEIPVAVATGGELAETSAAGLTDAELAAVSLGGGGGWLLVEPAPGPLSSSLDETVAWLAERGYGSVIAHPERHLTHDLAGRLVRLVEAGALVQVTAAALVHDLSSDAMLELAARGLVHVIGSDSHSSRYGRPLALTPAIARLREHGRTAAYVGWIARTAPAAIVRGEPVQPPFEPQ
jgi:protein-tyrosine phosphatase